MKRSFALGVSLFGSAILASIGCASILGDEFKVGPGAGAPGSDSGTPTADGSGNPPTGEGGLADVVVGQDGPGPTNPLSCNWLSDKPRVLESVTGTTMSNDHGLFNRISVHHVALGGVRVVTSYADRAFRFYDFKTGDQTPPRMFELGEQGNLLDVKPVAGGIGILFQSNGGGTSQGVLNVFQLLDKSSAVEQPRALLTNPGDVTNSNVSATFMQRNGIEYDFLVTFQPNTSTSYTVSAGHAMPPFISQLINGPQRYNIDGTPLLYVPGTPDRFVAFLSVDVGGPSPARSYSLSPDLKDFSAGADTKGLPVSKKSFSLPMAIVPGQNGKFNVAVMAGDFFPSLDASVRIGQLDGSSLYGLDADTMTKAITYTDPDRLAIQGGSHWFGDKFATAGPGFVMSGTDFKPAAGLNFNYVDVNGTVLADLSNTKKLLTDLPGQIKGADFDASDDPDTFDVVWNSEVQIVGSNPPQVNDTLLYNQLRCHH